MRPVLDHPTEAMACAAFRKIRFEDPVGHFAGQPLLDLSVGTAFHGSPPVTVCSKAEATTQSSYGSDAGSRQRSQPGAESKARFVRFFRLLENPGGQGVPLSL